MIPHDLDAPLARRRMERPDVRLDVRWFESLPSTMDVAATLANDGAAHGVVVVADAQTAGRGRRGTTWTSPLGAGLYVSFIAKPVAARGGAATLAADSPLSLITLAAGVAVREGIAAATGLAAQVKWPNDVMVGRRKLAGILAEGIGIGTADPTVIIGVGINVQSAAYPPDVVSRATSIESELGRAGDRGELLAAVLIALWDRLGALRGGASDILQAWRAASPSAVGTRVEWEGRHGVTAGIDESGALLIKAADRVERIIAGEIRWML